MALLYKNPAHVKADSVSDGKRDTAQGGLISRNVTIHGRRTSVRLEPDMWSALKDICQREHTTIHEVCTQIALRKTDQLSLTAAIRRFIMVYYRAAATPEGHIRAGHGRGIEMMFEASSASAPASTSAFLRRPDYF